jgi:hypothetical protein
VATTRAQLNAEQHVVQRALPNLFGQEFRKRRVSLEWGGSFECDAMSDDGRIAVCVSTSSARTAGGKPAIGKYHKIRSDALYLLAAKGVGRRILVFTDLGMLKHFEAEQERGRFPGTDLIGLRYVDLPDDLRVALEKAVDAASREVTPAGRTADEDPV